MRLIAVVALLLSSLSVFAADAPVTFVEGKDYAVLGDPVRPLDPTKIEVAEVFSYACPHCFHFEPLITSWMKKQASDVALVQTHASFNPNWVIYQRGYYTVQTLHVKDKVQDAIFNLLHVQHQELPDAKAWAEFLAGFGVDKETTLKTFDSFGVNSQMKQADARVRGFLVSSTPQVIVDGRYRVLVTNHEEILKVAQFLVEKVRADRAAKH